MGRETCRNIARRRLAHKTHVLHIWNRIWQQTAMAAISRHLTLSGENCAGAHYRLTPNWKSSSCTCSRYLYSAVLFLNAAVVRACCLISNPAHMPASSATQANTGITCCAACQIEVVAPNTTFKPTAGWKGLLGVPETSGDHVCKTCKSKIATVKRRIRRELEKGNEQEGAAAAVEPILRPRTNADRTWNSSDNAARCGVLAALLID